MKYIIFDYDGTLHNSIKIYKPAFIKAYNYLVSNGYAKQKKFKEEEISEFLGLSAKDMWNSFMPLLPRYEKEKCSSIIGQAMVKYINEGNAELYDGAIETLSELKKSGYKLIFLSNCKVSYMKKHIEIFKLDNYFIDFYCSEDFNFKPKYKIFNVIKEKYHGDFIIVGDRFLDIEIAIKHNLYSIGCKYGFGKENELMEASIVIDNVLKLKEIFL